MPRKIDPRWVRFTSQSAAIAVACYAAGFALTYLPLGIPLEARRWIGAIVAMCFAVVGFAYLIVRAFDMFEVDKRGQDVQP